MMLAGDLRRVRMRWSLAAALAVLPAAPDEPDLPACREPVARVEGLAIAGRPAAEAPGAADLAIVRAGTTAPGAGGLPLCTRDTIASSARVAVHIRFATQTLVTLTGDAELEVLEPGAVWLKAGRAFVASPGPFTVRTVFAHLAGSGTETDISVSQAFDAVQIAGTTELARPAAPASAPKTRVPPLTAVTIDERGEPRIAPVDRTRAEALLDAHSDSVSAARPAEPRQSAIQMFRSAGERALRFRRARAEAIFAPSYDAFEALGHVYADWGDAERAQWAYGRADAQPGGTPGSARARALQLVARGNADRLVGNLDAAEKQYRQAIASGPALAPPYAGLGDVLRDRAAAAADRGQLAAAIDLAGTAAESYTRARDPNLWVNGRDADRILAIINLGDMLRQLAEYHRAAPRSTDPGAADRILGTAAEALNEARRLGQDNGTPEPRALVVAFATLELARARGLTRDQGDLVKAAVASAAALVEQARRAHPDDAVVELAAGDVELERGDAEAALAHFSRAAALDPGYPLAWFRRASTLTELGRADEARRAFQQYLSVESKIFRGGARMKRAQAGG